MSLKCHSRAHNIQSGASSNGNPGEVDPWQEHIIPSLVAAIRDAAAFVGRLRASKIGSIIDQNCKSADSLRSIADQLESLAQKGSHFAEYVEG